MKCAGLVLATLVCLALADGPALAQFDARPAGYGWLSSLAQGKALARKTGKPLMVVLRCEP
jgi:hypothetical protein